MVGGHASGKVDGLGDFVRIYLRGICNNPSSKTVAHKDNLLVPKTPKNYNYNMIVLQAKLQ